ncbi:hypothetical protein Ahy_A03g014371 [Arachis hypogaea]|uniref:Protein FAR1-RELATED SEQUENCE n=1 Tax=Arachis hypogaea TaxID=3818 RepID=A0A445DXV7_ARAHY|nr:hypothetical protein Ahy_A03g014371 [Arachis hypogaea]
MLEDTLTFMLPGPRRMNLVAIDQMNMMLKVDIKTQKIYASFVQTAGGCENVMFLKKDMYNRIDKQLRVISGDASAWLKLHMRRHIARISTHVRWWFSRGFDHHNQTIVFAVALVANETEKPYKWLLQ